MGRAQSFSRLRYKGFYVFLLLSNGNNLSWEVFLLFLRVSGPEAINERVLRRTRNKSQIPHFSTNNFSQQLRLPFQQCKINWWVQAKFTDKKKIPSNVQVEGSDTGSSAPSVCCLSALCKRKARCSGTRARHREYRTLELLHGEHGRVMSGYLKEL